MHPTGDPSDQPDVDSPQSPPPLGEETVTWSQPRPPFDPPHVVSVRPATSPHDLPAPARPVSPALYPVTTAARPRVWTVLIAPVVAVVLASTVQGVIAAVAAFRSGIATSSTKDVGKLEAEMLASPSLLLMLTMVTQLFFGLVAIAAAQRSTQPTTARLGLLPSAIPAWYWPLLVVGALFILMLEMLVLSLVPDSGDPEVLKNLVHAKLGSTGWLGVGFFVVMNLMPGLCEELMFRGYMQRRLIACWGPGIGIFVTAAIFAACHMYPAHMFVAFWLGLWLGILAWRAGSIWPGVVVHAATNALGFTLPLLGGGFDSPDGKLQFPPAVWAIGIAALIGGIVIMARARPATVNAP